jgi:DNA invertase Pin-like site-specific DNA recombinase
VRHLIDLVEKLHATGVGLRSVSDGLLDTCSANGRLIFHIFLALAEFERSVIKERTRAGLSAARARGRLGGRRPTLVSDPRVQHAKKLYLDQKTPIVEIMRTFRISRATLYRWVGLKEKKASIS